MIFSRYAGAGSHRYPVGFSGDSIISWKSLGFQPYFTATASNVGYGWWSHDIGGHMNGYRDDELAVRWVQYGVFSPIMRLHSSNSKFTGKEPWKYGDEERAVMNDFLRLRHRLIPYLYTMNARCYRENQPLIQPMYYSCPDQHEAYKVPNQYYFGSSLIVCPITGKMNPVLKAGKVKAWLPEGTWYDIFNSLIYRGNKSIPMYRTLKTIPVLAKAGAIVPMEAESSIGDGVDNPKDIELCVFAGADGEHIMYEDDGISIEYEEGSYAETKYTLDWNGTKRLTIYPAEGELSLIPKKRNYRIKLYGISKQDLKNVEVDAKKADYTYTWDEERNILTLEIKELDVKHRLNVWFYPDTGIACNKVQWRVFDILNRVQIEFCIKERLYDMAIHSDSAESLISNLSSVDTLSELKEMIQEIVFA
jgi:alpha-glucosidase (family GH31 glycosyl hydrolase)